MKVGDLIVHNSSYTRDDNPYGVIVHIFENGDICVLFEDGEYQVDGEDCDVIKEAM